VPQILIFNRPLGKFPHLDTKFSKNATFLIWMRITIWTALLFHFKKFRMSILQRTVLQRVKNSPVDIINWDTHTHIENPPLADIPPKVLDRLKAFNPQFDVLECDVLKCGAQKIHIVTAEINTQKYHVFCFEQSARGYLDKVL
jgi:hypothetical protein